MAKRPTKAPEAETDAVEAEKKPKKAERVSAMDHEELAGIVKAAVDDAVDYIDSNIAPEREEAQKFYRGEPLGDEEDGRSSIVMTEVRDVILAMMPSLLRIFLSSERYVEFLPRREDAIDVAEQQTDYINHIIQVDNPGFEIFYSAFHDALRKKTGIFKAWFEKRKEVVELESSGLNAEQLAIIMNEDGVEVLEVEEEGDEGEIEVRYKRTREIEEFKVAAVPPEEFLIARNARDVETADFVGTRQLKTISDLVAMGYDLDEITENAGTDTGFETNNEKEARNPALNVLKGGSAEQTDADPTMRRVYYTESFIRVDADGDGIAELRRICTLGDHHYILHDELWDDLVPFAVISPDPEPHMAIGYSMADQTKDLQRIKTNIVRNTLDSLAQSVFPRMGIVEGQVNVADALNNEVGAVIRQKQPGMVQIYDMPFVGQQSLAVLSYVDDIGAKRTGITKASQGLDPDVLQSTTKAAVTATMSAAQERIEMIARIFAETGVKRLFKILLRLVCRYQQNPRIVRLRGSFVSVDPRDWDAEMDVVVNVGLGTGNVSDRLAALNILAAKAEQAVVNMPDNPLFGIRELRSMYAKMLEMAGIKDVSRYVRAVPPDIDQQMAQQRQQAQGQAQDPTTLLAQVEVQKAKINGEAQVAKVNLDQWKAEQENDRERDRMEADFMLRAMELQLKYGAQVDIAQIKAMVDRERHAMSAQAQVQQAALQPPQPQGAMNGPTS
jgi:hypothetical protein